MFDFLPALVRFILVVLLVIFCIHRKMALWGTFLLAAGVLALLFGMSPSAMRHSTWVALSAPKNIGLALIIGLILALSATLEKCGRMQRMLAAFQHCSRRPGLNIFVFPALIGLLPMPGGAAFSAPMVKQLGHGLGYSPAQLAFFNYWFRHVWEYWWPLYPGVLLTCVLADIPLSKFVVLMLPLSALAVLLGYPELTKKQAPSPTSPEPKVRHKILPFLTEAGPIFGVIVLGLGLGISLARLFPELAVAKELGLITALLLVLGWVWHHSGFAPTEAFALLFNRRQLTMVGLILSILIFSEVLQDSGAVSDIAQDLQELRVPLILMTMLLPFVVGCAAGLTIAFVGASFPIVIAVVRALDPGTDLLPYMSLALVSGFVGTLLSPLHLCLLLSNEYFEVSLPQVYRHLRLPCAAMLLFGTLHFALLQLMG
ncbi:MAG: DUF401 family protein [Deltaproteobacteria bacterium]|nr:DUF401 family protein [Deltaproteobacteria bacterium]